MKEGLPCHHLFQILTWGNPMRRQIVQKLMSTDELIRDFVTSDDLSAIFSNVMQLFQVKTSVKTANNHSPYFPFSFI